MASSRSWQQQGPRAAGRFFDENMIFGDRAQFANQHSLSRLNKLLLLMEFLPTQAARVRSAATEMKYDAACGGWYRAEAPLSRGPIESWLHKPGSSGMKWSPNGSPTDPHDTTARGLRAARPVLEVENRNLARVKAAPPSAIIEAQKVGNVTRLVRRVPVL